MNSIRSQLIRASIAWLILIGFLLFTNPSQVPLPVLVAPFIILFIAIRLSLVVGSLVIKRLGLGMKDISESSERSTSWWPTALSVYIVLLALLGSLGQLTVRDTAALTLLFVISCFYLSRLRRRTTA